MKGYFDRVEENKHAVILVEELKKEFVIPVNKLPEGSQPKTWLDVKIADGQITSIHQDDEKTRSEQEKVDSLLSKIRSKGSGSKFQRK